MIFIFICEVCFYFYLKAQKDSIRGGKLLMKSKYSNNKSATAKAYDSVGCSLWVNSVFPSYLAYER